ncbi:MAG: ribosome silencing factor [Bacillaceae bacterium]
MSEEKLLKIVATAADDKRAENIIIMDMRGVSPISDYFLICHGNSDKQVQAIAKEIRDMANEEGYSVRRLEGYDAARWILIDMGDVVAHVFYKDERVYYNLEKLWGDAPQISVDEVLV